MGSDTRSRAVDVATVMMWNLSVQTLNANGQIEAENKVEGRQMAWNLLFQDQQKRSKLLRGKYYKEKKTEALFSKETVIEKLNKPS